MSFLPCTVFQSTLPAWGATWTWPRDMTPWNVSIHAPRVGSDSPVWFALLLDIVSIHAPRVGSDTHHAATSRAPSRFQSTLPAWGATRVSSSHAHEQTVSIHAPRVGSDAIHSTPCDLVQRFNTTLPAWGATSRIIASITPDVGFNPRSPRGERPSLQLRRPERSGFNPRSPRGERPLVYALIGL